MGITKFRYEPSTSSPYHGKCYIDGEFIPGVRSFTCEVNVDEIPRVDLEVVAMPTMELLADTFVTMPIENAQSALRCLRFYCQMRDDLRSRLEGAIWDAMNASDGSDTAKDILDAILDAELTGAETE